MDIQRERATTAAVRNGILQAFGIVLLLALLAWAARASYVAAHRQQWDEDAKRRRDADAYTEREKARMGLTR